MNKVLRYIIYILVSYIVIIFLFSSFVSIISNDKKFYLLSNPDNKDFMNNLITYAKSEGIKLKVQYADDLEILDYLKEDNVYDGVWMSNSIWLYMLNDVKVINSKSISINPVVMGVKKSKAESLNFTNKDIYNKDIMSAIKNKKLKYIMSSVTKTNTGLTAYLGFLNSLAGSPEILTSDMLK
ncbi:MAG: solute-binding protein, partial [Tenericutes bacterium]|nr:solute-binding protein [Mycoplasmatota bacterium]